MKIVDDIRELNSHGIRSGVNKELAKNIFSYVFQKEEYKNTGYYLGKTFLGGEDIEEFDKRVKEAINFIIKDSEGLNSIAIVTHGGVHRSIFKNILNINKKIPNKLLGVDIETAQPYEVEEKINNLLETEIKNVEDIAKFHQEFEHIHPFQDGNGRIGRFIILRQCILNNIDLIEIDNEFEKEYKGNLYIAQTQNNITPLVETFSKCQERLENKLKGLKELLKELDKNMIKTLKFRKDLSELILKNEKNTTWRIFDDKDIKEGDIIQFLVWETREMFAKAKITNVVEKKFKDLDEKDIEGHEKFASKEEMYETYSTYYNRTLDENTLVKIIKFELIWRTNES